MSSEVISQQEQPINGTSTIDVVVAKDANSDATNDSTSIQTESNQANGESVPSTAGVVDGSDENTANGGQQTPVPASATQGGRDVNKRILYVGNLDQHVSEDMLSDVFKVTGNVVSIKIFPDKNRRGYNYAFVEYEETASADLAFRTLNGRAINQSEITINWAFQSLNVAKNAELFNVFVGDLASEVNDEFLAKAFTGFGTMVEAHVMWDMTTSRSRGYGFVTFREHQDALRAIQTMNGEWLGSRAIRCNWASQKPQQHYHHNQMQHNHHQQHNHQQMHHHQYPGQNQMYHHQQQGYGSPLNAGANQGPGAVGTASGAPVISEQQLQAQQAQQASVGQPVPVAQGQAAASGQYLNQAPPPPGPIGSQPPLGMPMYDMVLRQTPSRQTTVYLGNIPAYTTPTDLLPVLQNFGYVMDFKYQQEREYAFIKYDTHENAALAISQLSGAQLNGRTLRCGWGRDKHQNNHHHHHNSNTHNHNQYQNYGRQYSR